jgi:hypothetical protein
VTEQSNEHRIYYFREFICHGIDEPFRCWRVGAIQPFLKILQLFYGELNLKKIVKALFIFFKGFNHNYSIFESSSWKWDSFKSVIKMSFIENTKKLSDFRLIFIPLNFETHWNLSLSLTLIASAVADFLIPQILACKIFH